MLKFDVKKEAEIKEKRLRKLMKHKGLDAVILTKQQNFAWITAGGDNHVGIATESGVASAVITNDKKYIVTSNIEAGRIADEEVKGLNYTVKKHNWWQDAEKLKIIKSLAPSGKIATDDGFGGYPNIESDIIPLRYSLTQQEIKKYKWLGKKAGRAMVRVAKKIKRGDTEHSAAGEFAKIFFKEGITPTVLLFAADERISKYRHPIPTEKKADKVIMLVLGARKWGLIVSVTRMVYFGKVPADLRKKHNAVVKIDTVFNLNTLPGASVAEIFKKAVAVYKETGYADEWTLHHQGGGTGYTGRDYRGMLDSKEVVQVNQAFAWNPSITGTKCEDTVIARNGKVEFITPTPGWPMVKVKIGKLTALRPDILEKNA